MHAARPSIGLLLLDTGFERIRGDVGHPGTWRFPVLRAVVPGVDAALVVQGGEALVEPFAQAALELVVGDHQGHERPDDVAVRAAGEQQ